MMWRFEDYKDAAAASDDAGRRVTYAELAAFAEEMKAFAGTPRARRLAFCLCENSIGSLAGYAAMIEAHLLPLMLDRDLDRELLQSLLDLYRPDYLWLPSRMREDFPSCGLLLERYGYALLGTSFRDGREIYGELALLLATSGSTGSPKLVRISYGNLRANTEAIAAFLKPDASERPVTTLPMYYTYGLSILNTHLLVGAEILLTDRTLVQREFWQFFRERGATSFGGVPFTYEMLKRLRFFRMDLPSLTTMTQAGGKLPPELHAEFAAYAAKRGIRFFVMYGQTEATARMAYLPPERASEKCGSVGIAIPGGRLSLIDTDGELIEESGRVGELVYEGPNVALGYAQTREDLAAGDEWGGRLLTGDMAERDADGFYYIVGRKKRFLKMFGRRVNLDEVDRLIRARFPGLDCAAAGVDDRMAVYLTDGSRAEEVRKFVADKTHINPSAVRTEVAAQIPRNGAGKILYAELEKKDD